MVLGCYYLTADNPTEQTTTSQYFSDFDDVIMAYKQSLLNLHTFVWVRCNQSEQINSALITNSNFIEKKVGDRIFYLTSDIQIKKDLEGNILQTYLKTTPGRILLNQSFESN